MLTLLLVMQTASAPPPRQDPPATQSTPAIVVTARRGAPPPDRFATRFRAACFDTMRRRRAVEPPPGEGWESTGATEGVADLASEVWRLPVDERGRTLTLFAQRPPRVDGLDEIRCTIVAQAGRDQGRIADLLSGVVRAPLTRRHVGQTSGVAEHPGWRQWLWSGMPARGSANWFAPGDRSRRDTYLVVTDADFYRRYDYVALEVRTRQDAALTIATLSLVERGN